ncbi:putative ATP-dependent DNA helicase II subunit 2, related protein [Rhizoctonia solani 123E]|uniref:ATP-dependent DNA helicase II subunit 2 n=1 Tax=Rhizoctonia solani 123E TaxID=1423351 RepID=A0A074SAF9_9AGAM|nr:putative ATP-dependent DNA helicase II subunit 2, related protein [Rhizoctonia solani 123E]
MPTERAGYTATMFVVDVSPSMGTMRTVFLEPAEDGTERTKEVTHLQWALQYVMLKVQEMIHNGRKTDQCGVVLFGTEDTQNVVEDAHPGEGYTNIVEYIPIAHPTPSTLSKIAAITPSTHFGDPINGMIVAIQTQSEYLIRKPSWTRRMVLVTDGETPLEVEDWEATVDKINELAINTTIIGVDFDDEDFPFIEPDKSPVKRVNENFWTQFIDRVENGQIGTCAYALHETSRPEPRPTKSAMSNNVFRIGDPELFPEEVIEIAVKTSKATALVRPHSMKKFTKREVVAATQGGPSQAGASPDDYKHYVELKRRTDYVVKLIESGTEEEEGDEDREKQEPQGEVVEKETLVKAFKYGSTWVPCEEGHFEGLHTRKGIEVVSFIAENTYQRHFSMSEVQYIYADIGSSRAQVAFSSIVHAMFKKGFMAVVRWVNRDDSDPKMGVCKAEPGEVDYMMWVQIPFAEDVRRYPFPSLDRYVTKKNEVLEEHPYIPTSDMNAAMDDWVENMDLADAGPKDENGLRTEWFDLTQSFNPAVHRIKQALFHGAVVPDLKAEPVPPPHPEVTKYMESPRRVLKRSIPALEQCIRLFNVKEVPPKVPRKKEQKAIPVATENIDVDIDDILGPAVARSTPAPMQARPVSKRAVEPEKQPFKKPGHSLPSPTPSFAELPSAFHSTPKPDAKPKPGRIISNSRPLADFKKNIEAQGDLVSKVVEDMCAVIPEIVDASFSTQRYAEALECMQVLREVALKEDEIDAWNNFLREFKATCKSSGFRNKDFWSHVQKVGRKLSLISDTEAEENEGMSDVTDRAAAQFMKN